MKMTSTIYLILWALGTAFVGCAMVWVLGNTIVHPLPWLTYAMVGVLGLGVGPCIGGMGIAVTDGVEDGIASSQASNHENQQQP